ncbi:unnamed protein product [Ectocarpus sp. CCAP 1310/34]|nr:unnamed protein product [Ectocarpus sp. CCAP 1310/34]
MHGKGRLHLHHYPVGSDSTGEQGTKAAACIAVAVAVVAGAAGAAGSAAARLLTAEDALEITVEVRSLRHLPQSFFNEDKEKELALRQHGQQQRHQRGRGSVDYRKCWRAQANIANETRETGNSTWGRGGRSRQAMWLRGADKVSWSLPEQQFKQVNAYTPVCKVHVHATNPDSPTMDTSDSVGWFIVDMRDLTGQRQQERWVKLQGASPAEVLISSRLAMARDPQEDPCREGHEQRGRPNSGHRGNDSAKPSASKASFEGGSPTAASGAVSRRCCSTSSSAGRRREGYFQLHLPGEPLAAPQQRDKEDGEGGEEESQSPPVASICAELTRADSEPGPGDGPVGSSDADGLWAATAAAAVATGRTEGSASASGVRTWSRLAVAGRRVGRAVAITAALQRPELRPVDHPGSRDGSALSNRVNGGGGVLVGITDATGELFMSGKAGGAATATDAIAGVANANPSASLREGFRVVGCGERGGGRH